MESIPLLQHLNRCESRVDSGSLISFLHDTETQASYASALMTKVARFPSELVRVPDVRSRATSSSLNPFHFDENSRIPNGVRCKLGVA